MSSFLLSLFWAVLGSALFALGFFMGRDHERARRIVPDAERNAELDYQRQLVKHWQDVSRGLELDVKRGDAFRSDVWRAIEQAGAASELEKHGVGRALGELRDLRGRIDLYHLDVLKALAALPEDLPAPSSELEHTEELEDPAERVDVNRAAELEAELEREARELLP